MKMKVEVKNRWQRAFFSHRLNTFLLLIKHTAKNLIKDLDVVSLHCPETCAIFNLECNRAVKNAAFSTSVFLLSFPVFFFSLLQPSLRFSSIVAARMQRKVKCRYFRERYLFTVAGTFGSLGWLGWFFLSSFFFLFFVFFFFFFCFYDPSKKQYAHIRRSRCQRRIVRSNFS